MQNERLVAHDDSFAYVGRQRLIIEEPIKGEARRIRVYITVHEDVIAEFHVVLVDALAQPKIELRRIWNNERPVSWLSSQEDGNASFFYLHSTFICIESLSCCWPEAEPNLGLCAEQVRGC